MNLSAAGLKLITDSEGFRSRVYHDVGGRPTIGYGHLLREGEAIGTMITEEDGLTLLDQDVTWAEDAVNSAVKVPLTQNQFDALVDFTYNLGAARLFNASFIHMLNNGNYAAVPVELARYDMVSGHVEPGLSARRAREGALWNAPVVITV